MSLPEHTTDVDEDLSPSAKYVVFVLEDADESLSRRKLQNRTGLSERTVDRALDQLESKRIAERVRDTKDLRCVRVRLFDRNS
ncbi:MarR family transcriptional regulator [Natronolimnobius baerhuensis]|uniref:MarR family transcriptional regulator n=1 Tax=Natronolimnobius baerhuensis TaxID=253108 RepID=A0A202E4R4_9EURY|nr:MarR family transcriptional regulator [Natronolimnobius baerhuensis]